MFRPSRLHARGMKNEEDGEEDGDDDEDDREYAYASCRWGRWGMEEGGGRPARRDGEYGVADSSSARTTPPSSGRYKDDVEFFDLDDEDDDDDDMFDDDDFAREDRRKTSGGHNDIEEGEFAYNGIIPNPLLDAMDPEGLYERLGPELFKYWTFFRDMALFAQFLTLFTGDTHLYGTFDSVIERLEDLPSDFIKVS